MNICYSSIKVFNQQAKEKQSNKGIDMNIGITLAESKTQYFLNKAYIDYIVEAGHQPIVIAPSAKKLPEIDALIMPGGTDVDPIYYGFNNQASQKTYPTRDKYEREIFHAYRQENIPIFGICRGFQLMFLEYQREHKTPNLKFLHHVREHDQKLKEIERGNHYHFVNGIRSLLYMGEDNEKIRIPVNSLHHQGILFGLKTNEKVKDCLEQKDLTVAAWTNKVNVKSNFTIELVCEAYQINNWGGPIFAVQWHPEELKDYDLLNNFLEAHT